MKKGKKSELKNSDHLVTVAVHDLTELLFWARRYCDGRRSYAPCSFNHTYENIVRMNPHVKEKDQFDHTLKDKGAYWPYAQDGSFNASNGSSWDARPLKPRMVSNEGENTSGSI